MLAADLFDRAEAGLDPEGELAARIRGVLLGLLHARRPQATICPSEAARQLGRELGCEWRDLMRPVRYVAGLMVEEGSIEPLQGGRLVEIGEARGPIRLRLRLRQPRLGSL
jgi:hypothetical protein